MVKFTDAGEVDNKLVCVQHRVNEEWCPTIGSLTKCKANDAESSRIDKMLGKEFSNFREKWTRESTPTNFVVGRRGVQSLRKDREQNSRITSSRVQCKGRQPNKISTRGATVYGDSKTESSNWTRSKHSHTPECSVDSGITLGEYLMLTWFFSSYAIFKGALNLARGKPGRTAFEGWEFP